MKCRLAGVVQLLMQTALHHGTRIDVCLRNAIPALTVSGMRHSRKNAGLL